MLQVARLVPLATVLLAGCASMPDVEVGYYLPKAIVNVTVTQTAACTAGGVPVFTDDAAVSAEYVSDGTRRSISLPQLGSGLTKADVTVELHSDGRLKSVNSKTTGQQAETLRAFVKAAQGSTTSSVPLARDADGACKAIVAAVGEGKALTIVHRGTTTFDSTAGPIDLAQSSVHATVHSAIRSVFGEVTATYKVTAPRVLSSGTQGTNDGVLLHLVEPAPAEITVVVHRGGATDKFQKSVVALVPQRGIAYTLPIQKAPWFGSNEFELALDASGRITKLRYSSNGDGAGAFGFLSDVASASGSKTESATDRAKREADEIYQQQRLILCQTTPKDCPK